MKIKLLALCLILVGTVNAQQLHERVLSYYSVASNIYFMDDSYEQSLWSFYLPTTKLKRDSLIVSQYSYWNYQYNVKSKMDLFSISRLDFNKSKDTANVFVNQFWKLANNEQYIYQIKSEWIKWNGNWYISDKLPINVSVKPNN
ncbi:MAG: hypothetical protein ACKOX3_09090 [Bacteroidota bacterium]